VCNALLIISSCISDASGEKPVLTPAAETQIKPPVVPITSPLSVGPTSRASTDDDKTRRQVKTVVWFFHSIQERQHTFEYDSVFICLFDFTAHQNNLGRRCGVHLI
jgi:hypothetical protein